MSNATSWPLLTKFLRDRNRRGDGVPSRRRRRDRRSDGVPSTPPMRLLALLAELLGPLLEVRELLLGHRPLDPF